jgi:phage gp37-like protein
MRPAAYPISRTAPAQLLFNARRQRSLFASLIAALHWSRRAQARRVLRQHQHLIDKHRSGGVTAYPRKCTGLNDAD